MIGGGMGRYDRPRGLIGGGQAQPQWGENDQ
eukprot:CAMPEP_0176397042 /NCGR_PEP_ID=MMETSP0126-20121128/44797_1 /TAXON_ID=141414 ORGANISM="Strombidinopsis acuminatum, Strain SPMC142" /NCGR_SAMPLE_ID=MMETSP0126 /ASSEMBLY_ACC=CAM_ASM_000229 /LENGTH=30 /DNA_ID= /DNA_START= /DNA_END= /DNA_ORIENTATION=